MTAYLSFEWLKFQKRWMPRVIVVLLIALTVFAFWGQGTKVDGRANLFMPRGWLAALSFCSFFAPFFWPVLGASWAGNEYGWGTLRAVLTRRPSRIEHFTAALVVLIVGVARVLRVAGHWKRYVVFRRVGRRLRFYAGQGIPHHMVRLRVLPDSVVYVGYHLSLGGSGHRHRRGRHAGAVHPARDLQ